MPWTEITRRNYAREGLRYATDSTDEEWAVVARIVAAGRSVGPPLIGAMEGQFALPDDIFEGDDAVAEMFAQSATQ